MAAPFRQEGALGDLLQEIAEMTMVFPGSMEQVALPAYPWSPSVIEEMPEVERKFYLRVLRDTREQYLPKKR